MNIVFTNVPYSFSDVRPNFMAKYKKLGKNFGLVPGASEPLGLLYLAAVTKSYHTTKVLDGVFNNQKQILKKLKKVNPDLVGISIVTSVWNKSKEYIKNIKKVLPNTKIVVGGPHPSAWKENCINECKDIDFVVFDEGEKTIAELPDAIENNRPLNKVKGIIYRKGNKIIKTRAREPIQNLDEIPFPARELVNMKKYCSSIGFFKRTPHATMMTSRGCSHNCLFCSSQKNVRYRSTENIIKEIRELIEKYKIKDILFHDECFTDNEKRAEKLCNALIKEKFDITWAVNARVDKVNKHILKKMKKAGCWRILYGLESGVQKNINLLNKGFTLEQIKEAIRMTQRSEIEVLGMFIFGIPQETYVDGLKTIEFAKKLNLDMAKFLCLSPFPGTNIYRNSKDYGSILGFNEMNMHSVSFIPKTMTKNEIGNLFKTAYKKFYMRPKYLIKRILKIRSVEDIKINMRGFIAFSSA